MVFLKRGLLFKNQNKGGDKPPSRSDPRPPFRDNVPKIWDFFFGCRPLPFYDDNGNTGENMDDDDNNNTADNEETADDVEGASL